MVGKPHCWLFDCLLACDFSLDVTAAACLLSWYVRRNPKSKVRMSADVLPNCKVELCV